MVKPETCSICLKPLLPGQALHGFRRVHWDCHVTERAMQGKPNEHTPTFRDVKEHIRKMDEAMADLRKAVDKE